MRWLNIVNARLRGLFRREAVLGDIEEEMRSHVEMETETNIERGMKPEEARRAAMRSFGNIGWVRDRAYEVRGGGMFETLWQDLRYGVRMLLKNPGFTTVAVLSLALGIGANTAIFSLVEAVLLRPLPFREPDRLVMIWEASSVNRSRRSDPAPANYSDWRTQNRVFDDVAAFSSLSLNLTGAGEPEKINGQAVTANSFSLLGSKPALGRTFLEEDDRPEARKVVLLSYGLWQRRFGGDRNLIGKDILLNDQKFSVVGVMPADFQLLGAEIGLWVPAAFSQRDLSDRGSHYLTVIARLKAGLTLEQAQADLETIMERIAREFPRDAANLSAFVLPLHEHLAGGMRLALIVLLAAVGCVLLIACANTANLLLARAASRQKEIAVRAALGAGRPRIVRQLLTESVLLASLSSAIGLVFAFWSFAFLKRLIPESMAISTKLGISAPVFGYALLLTLLTGVSFGIAPALQAAKLDLNEALKQSAGRSGLGTRHRRMRGALVVAEVSLALVLLVGAGLLIQTFVRLRNLDLGFRSENVLTVTTSLSRNKYGELAKRDAFYRQVLERVRALPGVVSAAYTTAVPIAMKGGGNGFSMEGRAQKSGQFANQRQISPDYFRTLGIPLHKGRYLDEHDGPESPPVAIINETMARNFWPDEEALGKRFKLGPTDSARPWVTIVGIVGDAKHWLDAPVRAEMYFPYQQAMDFWATPASLAIRTAGDPLSLGTVVRQAIWAVDADQPISNIKTMDDIIATEVSQRRLRMSLLATFAAVALLLASLGIYGVLSYAVTQRTPEIGMRMALGARPGDVLRMVLTDGMRLSLVGLGIGLAASLASTRVMSNLLFGVSATDPLTFVAVSLLLMSVSLIACYVPARRATRIDPLIALRHE
jgi:predicted permease